MKTPAALLAFSAAACAVDLGANDGQHFSGINCKRASCTSDSIVIINLAQQQHFPMPTFANPFARPAKPTGPEPESWKASPHSRKKLRKMDSGGIVSPGKVLSKGEREQIKAERADSVLDPIQAQEQIQRQQEYEWSFAALKDQFLEIWTPFANRIGRSIDAHWAPNATAYAGDVVQDTRRHVHLRSCIVLTISFLIVFGALSTLAEYLLFVTRATACSVSTVYLPVTITVTANGANSTASPSDPSASDTTSMAQVSMTSTSTHTVTSYVTLGSPTKTSPYVYTVDPAGSTHWINGVSPPSTVSLITMTTSVFVAPSASTGLATLESTTLSVEYLTLPTYTSTEYTFVGPQVTTTSTTTSTNTVTYTLSYASPSNTDSRSAFSGISSAGWNASTTPNSGPLSILTSSVAPDASTSTSVYYTSSGPPTTSTTTTFITATISRRLTVTITPSSSEGDPENTASSGSSPGGWPSTLSSISTTHNGTMVSPESASMSSAAISVTTVPIPSSLLTLLTTRASNSVSEHPITSTRSLVSSMSSSGGTTASNSSTTGAMTGSLSTLTPAVSTSSSSSSPTTANSGSSTSGVQITNTMSSSYSVSSSSVNGASHQTSQTSRTISGVSSSSTTTKPSVGSTVSSSSSNTAAVSASSSSSNGPLPSTSSVQTRPSIYSTLSGSSAESSPSSGAPGTSSSSMNSSGSAASPASSATSLSQTSRSHASAVTGIQTTLSHTHHRPAITSTNSNTESPSSSSSETTNSETTLSTSHTGSHVSSSSSSTPSSQSRSTSGTDSNTVSPSTSSPSSGHSKYTASTTTTTVTSRNPFPPSSATATPTGGCGEHGSFLVDFDNLPSFTPTNRNDTDITQAPPIENPYWHLTWNEGYVYAPQPHEPYTPVSPPHLAVFLADGAGKRVGSHQGGNYSKPGEISDGPREAISAFWFDAYSAWFGCDNRGPAVCTLVFSAYTWSPKATTEVLVDKTTSTVQPCKKSSGCDLELIEFPATFRSLSGLQVQAFVGKEERMFFMDDLSLHWTNNTCAAGLLRQSSS